VDQVPDDEIKPLLVPVAQAAKMLGYCRATIYRMEKAQQIRIVRPLKRAMVPVEEIERIVRGEPMHSTDPVAKSPTPRPKKVKLTPKGSA
jgi:Helix-turn-helix domain